LAQALNTKSNLPTRIFKTVCPHDCPSACGLEVQLDANGKIAKVHGGRQHSYTDGVICAKVSRYSERIYHPDRVTVPLRRVGEKGAGKFTEISWEEALDEITQRFGDVAEQYGGEAVWLYYFAGTMGLLMRDGINRLARAKGYSGMYGTICVNPAWTGFMAGTGLIAGVDPREMALSDCVVLWGTNPVNTQVNVMRHALKARKTRNAKIVHVDVYHNATSKQADMALIIKPGTDAALACAVMHILFRDGYADLDYLDSYTDCPDALRHHLTNKTPAWASEITGLSVGEIEAFAQLIGATPRSYFRLGYGFTRQRNGTVNMHAALSIATVLGAWKYEGGGAFHNNTNIYRWNKTLIEGLDIDAPARMLDQSRIGEILCGDTAALRGGGPVRAMLIQNTNPAVVAPDTNKVLEGLRRDDLFLVVHEQFMTETAALADIVLPATMFLEHDDLYQGGGHQHIMLGQKIVDAPGTCRSNHEVISELGKRLGGSHAGFEMAENDVLRHTLEESKRPTLDKFADEPWFDCQPDFNQSHYLDGFSFEDGKFRFSVDWKALLPSGYVSDDVLNTMPGLPDHWDVLESTRAETQFCLVTAPARHFLNSSFTETKTSRRLEGRPCVMIHPLDADECNIADGGVCRIGNDRGQILVHAKYFEGVKRGVLVVESLWPNKSYIGGIGVNSLTGADPVAPVGGVAFHDNAVWIKAHDG
jgi:anaerobic selenocysteine-containing dehydrogenase